MIIEFDKDKWYLSGIKTKVNKYLQRHGCDTKLPVNLENLLINKGVALYIKARRDENIANFIFKEDDRVLYLDRSLVKDKNKYLKVIAFILATIEQNRETEKLCIKNDSKEVLLKHKNFYRGNIDFNQFDSYKNLSKEQKKIFRENYYKIKIEECLSRQDKFDVETFVDIEFNLDFDFVKNIEKCSNKTLKERLDFAKELFKRDISIWGKRELTF